jgi:hypothetical protein
MLMLRASRSVPAEGHDHDPAGDRLSRSFAGSDVVATGVPTGMLVR